MLRTLPAALLFLAASCASAQNSVPICSAVSRTPTDAEFFENIRNAIRTLRPAPKFDTKQTFRSSGESHIYHSGLVPTASRLCMAGNTNSVELRLGTQTGQSTTLLVSAGHCLDLGFSDVSVTASCEASSACSHKSEVIVSADRKSVV